MDFVDRMLLRLADSSQRESVFDQVALGQIAAAAYRADVMPIRGPYEAAFDALELGVAATAPGSVEGTWHLAGSTDVTEARFRVGGVTPVDDVGIDALWRGAVIARFAAVGEPIADVDITPVRAGRIDAEIVAAQGALPTDPGALEAARRAQLLADVRSGLDQPGAFTEDDLDRWLAGVGALTVGALVERLRGIAGGAAVKVTYAPPVEAGAAPRPLPLTAAILIRDAPGFSLAALLADSKRVRASLDQLGMTRAYDDATPTRVPLAVVWLVPAALFADADWPGASSGQTPEEQAAARRASAGDWLASEGIGLAAV